MYLSKDEIDQLKILKKKTPSERFLMMIGLINGQIEVMKAGIKHFNKDMSQKDLKQCLKKRMLEIYSMKH